VVIFERYFYFHRMDLQHELSQRPDKEKVLEIAACIGDDQDQFSQLIDIVIHGEEPVSRYGSWLMNHCMEQHPQLVQPHLAALMEKLSRPKLSEWIVRSTVKAMAEAGEFPEELQGHALQHCFDYLLDPKTAVAIQVHAMQTAFNISKNEPDLLNELKMVIEERLPYGTAAYKSRGKRIVKAINKLLS
jgi:hypothetical protein